MVVILERKGFDFNNFTGFCAAFTKISISIKYINILLCLFFHHASLFDLTSFGIGINGIEFNK